MYLASVARRSSCQWVDAAGKPLVHSDVQRFAATLNDPQQRTILSYWISDVLTVAMLPLLSPVFAEAVPGFRCLIDDTLGGRIGGHYIASVGGTYARLPLPDDPMRLTEVQKLLAEGGSYAFPVDGGGPYRKVGTGLIGLALGLRATIMPLAAWPTRGTTVGPQSRVRMPLPGARVIAAIGAPIVVQRKGDRQASARSVERALDALGQAVVRRH